MWNQTNATTCILSVLLTAMAVHSATLYVDNDAANDPGPNDPEISDPKEDGSPAHPFDAIQEAIDASVDGDEVVVLDGVYTGTGNTNISLNGKAITVRSAGGPTVCVIDGAGSNGGFLINDGEGHDTIIDGFTIHDGMQSPGGSGFLLQGSSPTIRNCMITNGFGLNQGGAISVVGGSPHFIGCTFANNWTNWWGGGLAIQSGGEIMVQDCVFSGNAGLAGGGGIWIDAQQVNVRVRNCVFTGNMDSAVTVYPGGSADVANCVFSGNTSFTTGAGVNNFSDDVTLSHCTLVNNVAGFAGGALDGASTVRNCIVWDNVGDEPGEPDAIAGSQATVLHSIVEGGWDGKGEVVLDVDPQFQPVKTGTWTAAGVYDPSTNRTVFTDADASFQPGALVGNALNPDDTQSSQFYIVANDKTTISVPGDVKIALNNIDAAAGDAYVVSNPRVSASSPAIDAGNNLLVPDDVSDLDGDGDLNEPTPVDLEGVARFIDVPTVPDTGVPGNGFDAVVDLGAFETTASTPCAGDLNANDIVGIGDLLALLAVWGPCESCAADFDADGMVGISDLLTLLSVWGTCS